MYGRGYHKPNTLTFIAKSIISLFYVIKFANV